MQHCYYIAFAAPKIFIAVGSDCVTGATPSSVVVSNTSVTLACCVEGVLCPTIRSWHRNTSNDILSHNKTFHVKLIEPQETFICKVISDYDNDPHCIEPQSAVITLIQQGTYNYYVNTGHG